MWDHFQDLPLAAVSIFAQLHLQSAVCMETSEIVPQLARAVNGPEQMMGRLATCGDSICNGDGVDVIITCGCGGDVIITCGGGGEQTCWWCISDHPPTCV